MYNQLAQEAGIAFKTYLLKIYGYMSGGLLITGLFAFFTASSNSAMKVIYGTPLQYLVMFAPLGFVLALSFGINKFSVKTSQVLFWSFAAIMGISLSYIFRIYTGMSLTRVFLVTSATFLTMSIYGYTTKKDLSRLGSIMFMGLIGIIIASLVNMFMKSTMFSFIISCIGVLIFTGLTAYDTQRAKLMYDITDNAEISGKKSIMGALSLYLNFINLFLMLLRIMGGRR